MILADENIDKKIIEAIRGFQIEVVSVQESRSGATDFEIMEWSKHPSRIILTEDKDFGEWVFAHKIKGVSILFLRYEHRETDDIILVLKHLLMNDGIENLKGKFTTVTPRKLRIRDI